MANDLNSCTFIGRLGRDPEVKNMSNGDAAVNISIAVGKSWTDKNTREKKEQTTWVPVSFFGKTAEIIGQYCKKGSQLMITGEFTVRKYTDKDGNEKQMTEIRGRDMQLLGGRPDSEGGRDQNNNNGRPAAAAPRPAQRAEGGGHGKQDEDIPFAPYENHSPF